MGQVHRIQDDKRLLRARVRQILMQDCPANGCAQQCQIASDLKKTNAMLAGLFVAFICQSLV